MIEKGDKVTFRSYADWCEYIRRCANQAEPFMIGPFESMDVLGIINHRDGSQMIHVKGRRAGTSMPRHWLKRIDNPKGAA